MPIQFLTPQMLNVLKMNRTDIPSSLKEGRFKFKLPSKLKKNSKRKHRSKKTLKFKQKLAKN